MKNKNPKSMMELMIPLQKEYSKTMLDLQLLIERKLREKIEGDKPCTRCGDQGGYGITGTCTECKDDMRS